MIIVDKALEKRQQDGNPIRVGLVGAGYIGRGIALQIEKFMTGMRLVAISNRTLSRAERAYKEAGVLVSWKHPLHAAIMPSPMIHSCYVKQKASMPSLKRRVQLSSVPMWRQEP
jgi:glutamyl-tRNA reductase